MFQHHFQNWTDLIYGLVLHKPCSLELLFTVAWMIWLNGNAARAGDTVLHPLTLMQQGLELQRQYQVAKGLRRAELWTMCDLLYSYKQKLVIPLFAVVLLSFISPRRFCPNSLQLFVE